MTSPGAPVILVTRPYIDLLRVCSAAC